MTSVLVLDVDGVMIGLDALPEDEPALPFGMWGTSLAVLDGIATLQEEIELVWLTTWFESAVAHFAGHLAPATVLPDVTTRDRGWWKASSLIRFLESRSDIDVLAWCDDHLGRYHRRRERVRRYCSEHGIQLLALCPDPKLGLTRTDVAQVAAFFATAPPARR